MLLLRCTRMHRHVQFEYMPTNQKSSTDFETCIAVTVDFDALQSKRAPSLIILQTCILVIIFYDSV
jgi:hypothetical protein